MSTGWRSQSQRSLSGTAAGQWIGIEFNDVIRLRAILLTPGALNINTVLNVTVDRSYDNITWIPVKSFAGLNFGAYVLSF